MDEFTCMYMIAELNRRLGDYDEAIKWFNRLVSSQDARKTNLLWKWQGNNIILQKSKKKS